ncbi:hypothetical protein DFH11DRAFT_1726387 [Phellopilus nigrolimitatus]|nr:hypothetical protein DFH11DRAFT_1726387 [Phellopilus nigrolimitatus]
MFRNPLANLKTPVPLRQSDRKRLKQRVLKDFGLADAPPETGKFLVPDRSQSVKFKTHTSELGVAYLSSDEEPFWMKADLIVPLWNYRRLLTALRSPAIVPYLVGSADLLLF